MSTPVNRTGELVDSREKLIFEAYKNKSFDGSKKFKTEIISNYGFEPSSDLYRKIVNYQIEKYGHTLTGSKNIEYVPNIGMKDKKTRQGNIDRNDAVQKLRSLEKRNENKNSIYSIEKDPYVKKYIVWECHKNYKIDVYAARTKKECKDWVNKKVK